MPEPGTETALPTRGEPPEPTRAPASPSRQVQPQPLIRTVPGSDLRISTSVPDYDQAELFGLKLSNCTIEQLVGTVEAWVDQGVSRTAAGVNANVVNLSARRPETRELFRANDVNYLDGQSLVWASRLLGLSAEERVATTDVALPLAQMCKRRDFGLFLLGGQPEVAQKAAARLEAQVPGLKTYTHDGFFTPDQDEQVVQAIVASGAKVVLVGLGDPRQQQWVQQHRYQVNGVMLTCGGLFDWISGNNRRPPQWMVGWGLEWLWRMWLEPRRLARRYLVGNPEFLLRLAGAWFFRR
ncbi:WecB/TagA/CpsF family glycosyltransferase [Kineosporia babensis]|uniref:WecB/TagA/CpsF family glycosyltransferase n=1 Tax=Kineosporia babensis TaxID=499548 RepID=A0A9X1NKG4_9ACTN|nr:WecB/TagA/CpsF family glycosyltransferase [Kineosporia babensis]